MQNETSNHCAEDAGVVEEAEGVCCVCFSLGTFSLPKIQPKQLFRVMAQLTDSVGTVRFVDFHDILLTILHQY